MIIGITIFSIVINDLNYTIIIYKEQMGDYDKKNELDMWMLLLQRYTDRQPLPH